jgi:hypothetical protein
MADATVGALRVTLGADTARFEEGLSHAEKTLATFGKNIATIAAGIGLERIVENTMRFVVGTFTEGFDRIDKVGKEAQKAGLGVEAFSGLMLSAELADVSMQTLTTSLGKLSKNMVDTSNGTGEAQKTFQALGIEVTNTDGSLKTSSQVLTEIAGKFENSADGAGKTAAAMALLGKSGRELIPMLNDGAAGLAEMQKTAEAMGLVIDSNTSNAVQKFNDNLKILAKTQEGIANMVIAEIIPALVRLSEQLVGTAKSGDLQREAANLIIREFQGLVVAAYEVSAAFQGLAEIYATVKAFFAATNLEQTQAAWDKFTEILGGFSERLREARAEGLNLFNALTVPGKKAVDDLTVSTSKLGDTIAGLKLKTAEARGEYALFATGFATTAAQIGLTDKGAQGLSKTVEGLTPQQRELNKAMLDFQGARMLTEALTPAEQYEKKIKDIQNLVRETAITHEEAAKLMVKAAESTGQSWTQVSKGIAGNFSSALDQMAKDNKDFAVAAKAAAITLALINTYEGVTKALASVFWPLNLVAAGAVLAAGLAQVSAISGLHFAKGGSFKVGGGLTGVDSEMVSFRATPGEMVDVRRPGQAGGGGGPPQTINLNMPRPNDFFSQHVREMVYALNKAAPNGYVLKVAQ